MMCTNFTSTVPEHPSAGQKKGHRQRVWQSITADSGSTRQHALFEGLMHQQGSHVGQTSH